MREIINFDRSGFNRNKCFEFQFCLSFLVKPFFFFFIKIWKDKNLCTKIENIIDLESIILQKKELLMIII